MTFYSEQSVATGLPWALEVIYSKCDSQGPGNGPGEHSQDPNWAKMTGEKSIQRSKARFQPNFLVTQAEDTTIADPTGRMDLGLCWGREFVSVTPKLTISGCMGSALRLGVTIDKLGCSLFPLASHQANRASLSVDLCCAAFCGLEVSMYRSSLGARQNLLVKMRLSGARGLTNFLRGLKGPKWDRKSEIDDPGFIFSQIIQRDHLKI